MNRLRRFFVNGIIMTVTSFLLRTLGVAFNAFVSRELGADGMGLFTLIMSVYGLSVTLAASGVNLASTRMCADAIGRGDTAALGGALRRCLLYAVSCGSAACIALFFGASHVAVSWLGDARCAPSLRLLALSLPFIAASNVLHGYFTAVRKVPKSAAVQIFEQLFKVFVTVWALLYIVPDGIEYSCMALVGGGALAECASFTLALILYLADRYGKARPQLAVTDGKRLTRELFKITVPVAAAAYVRSGLSTLEHILIPRGLRKNPLTAETALAAYGTLCGMAMPVVMFPTALLYSFTGLLVPEFTEAQACSDHGRVRRMISRVLSLTLIFSIGCAALMTALSRELGMLIYNSTDAGEFIRIMAPLIPLMYLDHATDAMLKGLGEQLYCMKVNILDSALCTLLVYLLCPRIGIYGYVLTVYLAEAANMALSLARLLRISEFRASVFECLIKPLLCVLPAAVIPRAIGIAAEGMGWSRLIASLVVSVLVYVGLLLLTGTLEMNFSLSPHAKKRCKN